MKNKKLDTIINKDWLNEHKACSDGKAWAVSVIGEGLALRDFLPIFGRADWLLWTLYESESLSRTCLIECAVVCAESVIDIFEKKYPDDQRPRQAIEAAKAYCLYPSEENKKTASAAASVAHDAASAASAAAAADATYSAYDAAYAASAAYCAASAAASAAAAADATYSASAAANYRAARKNKHKELCAVILDKIIKSDLRSYE